MARVHVLWRIDFVGAQQGMMGDHPLSPWVCAHQWWIKRYVFGCWNPACLLRNSRPATRIARHRDEWWWCCRQLQQSTSVVLLSGGKCAACMHPNTDAAFNHRGSAKMQADFHSKLVLGTVLPIMYVCMCVCLCFVWRRDTYVHAFGVDVFPTWCHHWYWQSHSQQSA